MKVLHLTLEFPPQIGGIANYVVNFAAHTPPTETVVYAPLGQNTAAFDASCKFKVYRQKPYWLLWPHWLRMLGQVWRIVKRENISVIYVHQVLPAGYIAFLIKIFLKIPYIIFFHGTDIDRARSTGFRKKRLQQLVAHASAVVANSQFLAEKIRQITTPSVPVHVLYPAPADYFFNPVDPHVLSTIKSQLALHGKKVLLSVGRMVPGKGFATLARLLPRIAEEFPDVVWLAVGEGSEKTKIIKAVTDGDVHHITRFLGAVPSVELPRLYQLADIFIQLNGEGDMAEEGWGTVFAEAGASAIPVIAGRNGGTPEVVRDTETGLLVAAGNDEEILDAIRQLLLKPAYAEELGRSARAWITNELTWQKQLEKFSHEL